MKNFLPESLALLTLIAVAVLLVRTCGSSKEHPALNRTPLPEAAAESFPAVDLTGDAPDGLKGEKNSERSALSAAQGPEESLEDRAWRSAHPSLLRGLVKNDAGAVVRGCRVVLEQGGVESHHIANQQGEFHFKGVQAGDVRLYISQSASLALLPTQSKGECATADRPWYGATCVRFDPPQADPVELVLMRAAFLEGRIVDSFGSPQPGAIVEVKDDRPDKARFMSDLERTDEDGRFSVRVLPGTTRLRTFTSAGSALQGSGRPPESEHVLQPGETMDVGDLVIGGGGVNVSGRVVDQEGHGAELVPVRARLVGSQGWMTTETGMAGSFLFEGVYPGRYEVEVAPGAAREGDPARFLHKPRAAHEIEVTGAGGSYAIGNFKLDFDDSYHLYGTLEFAEDTEVVKTNIRIWAVPSGSSAQPTERVYFVSRNNFEWHVREPSLYSRVHIEVIEIHPETKDTLRSWTLACEPVAQGRERLTFEIE